MPQLRQCVNWAAIAAHLLHPRKVEIIEALACIGRPLSTTDWLSILDVDNGGMTLQQVHHHVVHLETLGVLILFEGDMEVESLQRNARHIYYAFAPEVLK